MITAGESLGSRVRAPAVVFGPQPWIMGVLNVTPDSFSDGGLYDGPAAAVQRGVWLAAEGAHLVDVGGESTRPGATRVTATTEISRVVPVIRELTAAGVACSVDTMRADVAVAAVGAGAVLINDVSGGRADPEMFAAVAGLQVPFVLVHWRGPSAVMHLHAEYDDVVERVLHELRIQVERAIAGGVRENALVLDPGIGFAKDAGHNWELLRQLPALVAEGMPVLLGVSRKRFLGELLADVDGSPRPTDGREAATAALSLLAAQQSVWGVRVHEPRPSADAFAVLAALSRPSRHLSEGPLGVPIGVLAGPVVDGAADHDRRHATGRLVRG